MALTPTTHGLGGYRNDLHHAVGAEAQQPFGNDILDQLFISDEKEIPADDDGRINSPIPLDDLDPAEFQAFQINPDTQKSCYGYDMQGDMFYRHDKEGLWIPAYRHVDIRQWLLEDADRIGVYDTPPERGRDVLNQTSFLSAHKTWGSDRPHRPEILFTHNPTADRSRDQYEVQTMRRYGKIVIGSDDLPVKDYRNMPDTISTAIEGFRLEAIERQDVRIKHQDFRSRMVPHSINKVGDVIEPPSDNTLSARMRRFRTLACLYCWGVDRDGSVLDKDFVEKKLPRTCKLANSTKGFRDLYKHELVERELLTFGKCLSRAGGRGVPKATRSKRREDLQAKYERLLKEHEEAHGQLLDGDADVQEYGERRDLDRQEFDLRLENGPELDYSTVQGNIALQDNLETAQRNIGLLKEKNLFADGVQPSLGKRKGFMEDDNATAESYRYNLNSRASKRAKNNALAYEKNDELLHDPDQRRSRKSGAEKSRMIKRLPFQYTSRASTDPVSYDGNLPALQGIETWGLQPFVPDHSSIRAQDAQVRSAPTVNLSIPHNTVETVHPPLDRHYNEMYQGSLTNESLGFSPENQLNQKAHSYSSRNFVTTQPFSQQDEWMSQFPLFNPSQYESEHCIKFESTQKKNKVQMIDPVRGSDAELQFTTMPSHAATGSLLDSNSFNKGNIRIARKSNISRQSERRHRKAGGFSRDAQQAQIMMQKSIALPSTDNRLEAHLGNTWMAQVGDVRNQGQPVNPGNTRRVSQSGIGNLSRQPVDRQASQGISQVSADDIPQLPQEYGQQLGRSHQGVSQYVRLGAEDHRHTRFFP